MPTTVSLQRLAAVRPGAVLFASGLALGLGVAPAGAAPSEVDSSAVSLATASEPSPVIVLQSGPTTWHEGAKTSLCLKIVPTEPDATFWWPEGSNPAVVQVTGEDGSTWTHYMIGPPYGIPQVCLDPLETELEPGHYKVHLDYEGQSEVDSVSWDGQFDVLPPAVTHVDSDLTSSWNYGAMPRETMVEVTHEGVETTWAGDLHLEFSDGSQFGHGSSLSDSNRNVIELWPVDEPVPGIYQISVVFGGGYGFLPSRQVKTVTVDSGVFATKPVPAITGTAKVGSTLTASPGAWSPAATGFTYVWRADGVVIDGATSRTLTVPASAAGKKIKVTVKGSRQYYATASATSAATSDVARGTFSAPRPTISGTKRVGATLTVDRGTWTPSPSSVKYVWKANGVKIATKTTKTFVIPSSARGKRLTVTVVGSRSGYTTKNVTSYRTSVIS
ncbi:hypothetical protein [Myceligenerans crystallogenes]|uniref:Uncharacterized protein n=1 Tax=Myceligenerans crystallogenes TaxID=316335 RepID=A0ABN2NE07_9MICO